MAKRIKKLAIKGKETVSNFIPFGANARDVFLNSRFTNNKEMNLEQVIPEVYNNINKYMQDIPFGFKYRFNYTLSNDGTPLVLDIIETTNHRESVVGEFVRENLQTNIPKEKIENFGLFQNKENKIQDFSAMFKDLPDLKNITELDTTMGTNFANLFTNDTNLINVVDLNTANVNRFENMFRNCKNLTIAPNMSIEKVPNIDNMFRDCQSLSKIPEYNFSTAIYGYHTFEGCNNLVNIPNLGLNFVTQSPDMFNGCRNLNNFPMDCNYLTMGTNMFKNCTNLKEANITATNLQTGSQMFDNCIKLYSLPKLNGSQVRTIPNMFRNCRNLVFIPESFGKGNLLVNTKQTFRNCINLQYLPPICYRNDSAAAATLYLENTYRDCPRLTTLSIENIIGSLPYVNRTAEQNKEIQWTGLTNDQIDRISDTIANRARINGWNLPYINTFVIDYTLLNTITNTIEVKERYTSPDLSNNAAMVRNALYDLGLNNQITDLTISNMNRFVSVINLFNNFTSLKNLSINFNKSLNGYAQGLFKNCSNLSYINNSTISFDSAMGAIQTDNMFYNCSNLKTINIDFSNAWYTVSMFENCRNLNSYTIKTNEIYKTQIANNMFLGCINLSLPIEHDFSQLIEMERMFSLTTIEEVNISSKRIKNMQEAFYKAATLKNINMDFANLQVTNLYNTFTLTSINNVPSNLYFNNIINLYGTFAMCPLLTEVPVMNLESANTLYGMFANSNKLTLNSYTNIIKSLPNYSQLEEFKRDNRMRYIFKEDISEVLKNIPRDIRLNANNKGWVVGANLPIYSITVNYTNPITYVSSSFTEKINGDDISLDPNGTLWRNHHIYRQEGTTEISSVTGLAMNAITNYYGFFNNWEFGIGNYVLYNQINYNQGVNFKDMFRKSNVSNIPFMNLNSAINLHSMFNNCNQLTNGDLINIVSSLPLTSNIENITDFGNNFVNYIGFSYNQVRNIPELTVNRAINNGWLQLDRNDFGLKSYSVYRSTDPNSTSGTMGISYFVEKFGNYADTEQKAREAVNKGINSCLNIMETDNENFRLLDFKGDSSDWSPTMNIQNFSNFLSISNASKVNKVLNIYINNATNMANMFQDMRNLEEVQLHGISKNVTNMARMFSWCRSIKNIPAIYTANVTDMNNAFHYCDSITNIPNMITSNVKNISYAFCSTLNMTNIPNFDFSNVINAKGAFSYMFGITDFPNYNLMNAIDTSNMFVNCFRLTTQPKIQISKTENTDFMFSGCSNLTDIIYQYDTNNVLTMNGMFNSCYNLINLYSLNMSNVISFNNMFENCNNLSLNSVRNIINIIPITSQLQGLATTNFIEYSGLPKNRLDLASRANLKTLVNKGWDIPEIDWEILSLEDLSVDTNLKVGGLGWNILEDEEHNPYYYPLNPGVHSSTATMRLNLTNNILSQLTNNTLYMKLLYSTESVSYDRICVYHNTSSGSKLILNCGGYTQYGNNQQWDVATTTINNIQPTDWLYIYYTKDGSVHQGHDNAKIYLRTTSFIDRDHTGA